MKRKQLSKGETKALNERLRELYSIENFVGKKDSVDSVVSEAHLIFVNGQPAFFLLDSEPMPTLKFLLQRQILKMVTVDMGAVKFVVQGADIMRPGIVELDSGIKKGEVVAVVDEKNRKPLAVCKALFSSEEIRNMSSGRVLHNNHFVGDVIWKQTA
jgi:PUA-domain protein